MDKSACRRSTGWFSHWLNRMTRSYKSGQRKGFLFSSLADELDCRREISKHAKASTKGIDNTGTSTQDERKRKASVLWSLYREDGGMDGRGRRC